MELPQLSLRDLFWLVLVSALAVGWWVDHRDQVRWHYSLRRAIRDAEFRIYVDDGEYYVEPMSDYQLDNHRAKKQLKRSP